MKIIIGSPVKGFALKETLKKHLAAKGHEVIDVGCYETGNFVKFPAVGERIAKALGDGKASLAINCCGSGTGASIAAGKFNGVCAVSCESVQTARLARIVNDANCLCLGEDIVAPDLGCQMADVFVGTSFAEKEGVPENIKDFWREARDELFARGPQARERIIETLA